MFLRITGVGLLVLLLPLAVAAQEAKTVEQLDQEVQVLKSEILQLKADISKASQTASTNKTNIESMLEQQSSLKNSLDELTDLIREQSVRQQQVLESIVQKDSSGTDVLRLSANMQKSEQFRQEMRKAVNDSLQQEGDVIIRNKMTTAQRIWVNQKDYDVGAGETLTLKVPVGTLTAQLPGQPLTNWTITAPKYEQKIDIVPSETVTAYRPTEATSVTTLRPLETTTVTTLSPLYTSTPVYVSPTVTSYYLDPFTGYWYAWPY